VQLMDFLFKLFATFLLMGSGIITRAFVQEPVIISQFMQPPPLAKTVLEAKLIVVARLRNVVLKPRTDSLPSPASEDILLNAGKYSVDVLFELKGHADHHLAIDIAITSSFCYNDVSFPVVCGKLLLLFLVPSAHSSTEEGAWTAVNSNVPLTPLPAAIDAVTVGKANDPVLARVVGVLLNTMSDSRLRKANSPLLENAIDPRLPKALLPYIDDPDRDTRVSICAALAANQVIAAIPRIVQLEATMMNGARGRNCIDALEMYKTTAALPLLNPLVFDADEFTRRNAMIALRNIASKKSIP